MTLANYINATVQYEADDTSERSPRMMIIIFLVMNIPRYSVPTIGGWIHTSVLILLRDMDINTTSRIMFCGIQLLISDT